MSSYTDPTAAKSKEIALLAKYLCRICKKPKNPDMFSRKEQNSYRSKMAMGIKVDWISSKLRCRDCTGESSTELLCDGPCHLWLSLDAFSKNQRTMGGDRSICIACVSWYENQEHDMPTGHFQAGDIAPDEHEIITTRDRDGESTADYSMYGGTGPEGAEDSDEDYGSEYINPQVSARDPLYRGAALKTNTTSTYQGGSISGAKLLPHQRRPEHMRPLMSGFSSATSQASDAMGRMSLSSGGVHDNSVKASISKTSAFGTGFNPNKYRDEPSSEGRARIARDQRWAKPVNASSKGSKSLIPAKVGGVPDYISDNEEQDMP